MFTAKDMAAKLKTLDECEGLDHWIETVLYIKFIQYGHPAIVDSYEITKAGWNNNGWTNEMRKRGFSLEYQTNQREGDYYRVTYPPQER